MPNNSKNHTWPNSNNILSIHSTNSKIMAMTINNNSMDNSMDNRMDNSMVKTTLSNINKVDIQITNSKEIINKVTQITTKDTKLSLKGSMLKIIRETDKIEDIIKEIKDNTRSEEIGPEITMKKDLIMTKDMKILSLKLKLLKLNLNLFPNLFLNLSPQNLNLSLPDSQLLKSKISSTAIPKNNFKLWPIPKW